MTNRRLACRVSSDRIFDWYLRLVWGLEPVVDASAGDSEEGLYDSEGQDIESDGDSEGQDSENNSDIPPWERRPKWPGSCIR